MGRMEFESKKRTQRHKLQEIILGSVKAVGLLSIALVAPNAIQTLKALGYNPGKRQGEVVQLSRKRLVKAGLLKYKGKFLELTEEGERKLRQLDRSDYKIKKPKRWDGKWRELIFDIPERRKLMREKLRNTLRSIGFLRLQDSVWIYPYPCEDLITLLKADFKIGKDLLYMIVDSVENDLWIRKHFNLK